MPGRSYWRDYIFRPQQYLCRWGIHKWSTWTRMVAHWEDHEWRGCVRCGEKQIRNFT